MTDYLRGDRLQPGWLAYIACSPGVRFWTGAANFKLGAHGPDLTGGIYQGLGTIVEVPNLRIPLNGAFVQEALTMSGVTAEMVRVFDADRDILRGARLWFARIELDQSMQPVAAPMWVRASQVDSPIMRRDGDAKPPLRTVGVMHSAGNVTRKWALTSLWTGRQQRLIDPDDSACDGVSRLAAGTDEIFPN